MGRGGGVPHPPPIGLHCFLHRPVPVASQESCLRHCATSPPSPHPIAFHEELPWPGGGQAGLRSRCHPAHRRAEAPHARRPADRHRRVAARRQQPLQRLARRGNRRCGGPGAAGTGTTTIPPNRELNSVPSETATRGRDFFGCKLIQRYQQKRTIRPAF